MKKMKFRPVGELHQTNLLDLEPGDGKSADSADSGAQPGTSIPDGEKRRTVSKRASDIMLELDLATKDGTLKEMFSRNEKECHKALLNLSKRRLFLGEVLFVQQQVVKRLGTRNFTTWVPDVMHLEIRTAYEYIDRWKDCNGVLRDEDEHEESKQPSLEVEGVLNATPECERTEKTAAANSPVELDEFVTYAPPRLHMTSDERDLLREFRSEHQADHYRGFHDTAMRMVAEQRRLAEEGNTEAPAEGVSISENRASSASPVPAEVPAQATP